MSKDLHETNIEFYENIEVPPASFDCPVCGAANASVEGLVMKDRKIVGYAFNCNECLTDFWSKIEEES